MDRNQCNTSYDDYKNMSQLPLDIQDRVYKDFLFEPFVSNFAFKGDFLKLEKKQNVGG